MFPPKLPFPLNDPTIIITVAKKFWDILFNTDKEQENLKEAISKKRATDIEKTEINDISELNALLMEFSVILQRKGTDIENEIMKQYNYFFDDFHNMLDLLNESNEIVLFKADRVQRKLKKMESTLRGTMASYISKRVSLDDEECRRILKLLPGETKKKQMSHLENTVLVEAVDEVVMKFKELVGDFEEQLVQVIEDKMDYINQVATEKESILSQLIESNRNNEQQNEEIIFKSMLAMSQVSYILNEARWER